ncbi:ferric iron reductase [Streptomyces sp. YC504]|uniref:Ferric iron reductase n=1 Tax=Streptomyces mesophilus TaxID=1775132 RepID=A0A6G4XBW7_9ACTN|nr:IucA/IucC family C-terminal-domain containing protein [Streptomyces mesophilus]NGO74234.1 ferric iron reductase [Streptomyces mesophilus]
MPEPLTPADLGLVASVGGFFPLRTDGAASEGATFAALFAGRREPLAFRVGKVASAIGAQEPRIAVSIAQLGLAARLWSIALGSAALHGRIPDLDPARLHWDPDASAPDDLALIGNECADAARPGVASRPATDLVATVLDQHLAPLAAAVRAEFRISEALLWGNAGSALAGAARELHRWAQRTGHPHAAVRARALTEVLFEDPRLSGTGTFTEAGLRRRSCCLYYRIPGGGVCGDCCFRTPPGSSATRRSG